MTIEFDGSQVPVEAGQTIGAALWAAGYRSWRTTRQAGASRGLFCGIGACFDCLVTIDGVRGQRACVVPARPGSSVSRAGGVPAVPAAPRPASEGPRAVSAAPRAVSNAAGTYDVAVVGGGPAGLAAAATAALGGCRVVLLDAAAELGGQFWRHRAGAGVEGPHRHGEVFAGLQSIVEERVDHVRSASVWFVEPGFALHTTAGRFDARRIVLATGAYDRVVPFPGWDLPGVVTPGAAQALLKGSGVLVGREVVVAGAGPFLLPVAAALAQAGARVVAVVEAGDPRRYLARRSGLPGVAAKLGEAAGYAAWLVRHRVPYHVRQVVTAANGRGTVSSVDVAALDRNGDPGAVRRLRCDAVAVGYGFTANVDLGLSLGCATRMGGDGGLAIATDADGRTSVPGVFAAGEITGVGGAQLSVVEGELAGDAVAREVGTQAALSRRDVVALGRRAGRLRAFVEAMHEVHAVPAGWASRLSDPTIVCRCEEVPYGRIAHAVTDLGAIDARSVKLLARPGMGWCQGRVCGYATAAITADLCGRAVAHDDLVALAHRPFAGPVLLGDLADQWAQGAG